MAPDGQGVADSLSAMPSLSASKVEHLASQIYFSLPRVIQSDHVGKAVAQGMLPKSSLEDGTTYMGCSRYVIQARWDAVSERFVYSRRYRDETLDERIPHPEDDQGFDVFVPVRPASSGSGPGAWAGQPRGG